MISLSGIQVDSPLAQNAAACEPVQNKTVLKTQFGTSGFPHETFSQINGRSSAQLCHCIAAFMPKDPKSKSGGPNF